MLKNPKQPRLEIERAITLASQLTIIPGFPDTEGAIAAAAEWLIDHCSREQAQAVVTKAVRTWGGNWTGLWDLEKMYNPVPGVPEFVPYDKPASYCEACNNTGVFGATEGGYVRCSCEYGQKTVDAYLDRLNGPPRKLERVASRDMRLAPPPPPLPERRITQADIDRVRLDLDKKGGVS